MSIEKMDIKVLYAEDDEDVRSILSAILSQKVKNVLVAKDGKEALELFHANNDIDVIVTDIEMPKMTGLELIRAVKQEINYPYIVITTAFNDTDFLLEAIELRINKFLFKPIRANQLIHILEEINETLSLRRENLKQEKLLKGYQDAIDKSSIVYITDINEKITYINENFSKIMGYVDSEILGSDTSKLKNPLEFKYDEIKNTISKNEIWQGILHSTNKAGETIITETSVCPMLNVDDSIREIITISYDITQKVNQDRELQRLHAKIRQDELKKVTDIKDSEILSYIPFASCIIDETNKVLGTNKEFIELFDYMTMKDVRDKLQTKNIKLNDIFDDLPSNLMDGFGDLLDEIIDDEEVITKKDDGIKYFIQRKKINNKIIVSLCKKNG